MLFIGLTEIDEDFEDFLMNFDLAGGLIIGSIFAFFLAVGLGIRQLILSTRAKYVTVASTEEDSSSEKIWSQKNQPPAYIEDEEQQEEDKKPFLI